jgi:hypothetical protein
VEVGSIDALVLLVCVIQKKVEVARDRPRPNTSVTNALQLFQEDGLLNIILWPING